MKRVGADAFGAWIVPISMKRKPHAEVAERKRCAGAAGHYRQPDLCQPHPAGRDRLLRCPARQADGGGTVVGQHDGVHRFTIGQRKGLGLSGSPTGAPVYVLALDAADRRVVVVGGPGQRSPS